MGKLSQAAHKYGSAFEALTELDNAIVKDNHIYDAKIQAVADTLENALARIQALEDKYKPKKKPATRGKSPEAKRS